MNQLAYRPYIRPLIREQQHRGVRSVLSLLGIINQPLRTHLTRQLGAPAGTQGSLLADPVFEPTFGWTESDVNLASLDGTLLNRRLVKALSNPPEKLAEEYSFPLERHPFTHQLQSWKLLSQPEPKSLVVTSGTGSGKTECFMLPILNRLANQADAGGSLTGVRALFIYPLNALIASQQNRLDAWTDGFNGDLRYCLYTGQLEQKQKTTTKEYAGQVIDRDGLRKSPPPMLITNATMLEYMLIRKEDAPILEQSQGKLEWIVLDEAHTYVGSQAAEMALLLRRTMIAFGVKPSNVRFIATSATFGQDAETEQKLKRFLADMAGIDASQVEVVFGHRKVPTLPAVTVFNDYAVDELEKIQPDLEKSDLRFATLAANKTARHIRATFLNDAGACLPQSLSKLKTLIASPQIDTNTALKWLDILSGTRDANGMPFLPLRIHLFHNVLSSVGACVNKTCSERSPELLEKADWNFGAIYTDSSTKCKCGSPVLPLMQCTDCAEPFLKAFISTSNYELRAAIDEDVDEFALNNDVSVDAGDEEPTQRDIRDEIFLCNSKYSDNVTSAWLDLETKKLSDKSNSELSVQVNVFTPMDDVSCPCCLAKNHNNQFRRLAVGAPFTLSTVISSLLEFCPADKKKPGELPFSGRKMISFTDSRQGTARTAVKIQQDSERGKVRSFVYHSLVNIQGKSTLSEDDLKDLAELKEEKKHTQLSPRDQRNFERLIEQDKSGFSRSMSWDEMVQQLSMDSSVQHAMLDYYRRISPRIFQDSLGPRTLSKLFLFREFARRPKHQNSLESMGLVRVAYPSLNKITKAPIDWPNGDLPSWKNYLKLLLDFYIRDNSFVAMPPEYIPLIGARIRPRWLMAPTSKEDNSSRKKRWPQAEEGKSRYARPISFLLAAFNWASDAPKIQAINRILCDAWNVLIERGILKNSEDGFFLSFDELHFQLIENAGLCPFTRRFIDTDFAALSPYLGSNSAKAKITENYQIPIYPIAFNGTKDADVALIDKRLWLETNQEVVSLRNNGLWSDLHDRIIEGAQFFRTAEHSAQQSQKRLKEYESLFKQGRVNLLSCSTTMEMGVDIGGITIVAMNNVPPHPANYLQRAGRAGRRSETRSVAMTVCKQTPHDQSVFKDPMWPFKTKISVPEVSLRSHDLLQRHINSYLLSNWLKTYVKDAEALKLTSGAFFTHSGDHSFADRFSMWSTSLSKNLDTYPVIQDGLILLTKNTAFTIDNLNVLAEKTTTGILAAQQEWRKSQDAIRNQIEKVFSGAKESNPALKALSIQQKRLEDEYLLSELAECHFLPGYGFPAGIVAFDNLSMANYQKVSGASREDNRGRFRQLPSRDRATGIREYAPGAEIVIDGLVYRSSGVTLNWHAPVSEKDFKEAQLFKFAWHCKECGAAGSSIAGRPDSCESCGKELQRDRIKEYLIPSGFAVEFYGEDPHTDVSAPVYVPVQQPWLSLNTNWMPLANPASGQFRSSNAAHLFHYTSGTGQNGFAICLECGKAEQMLLAPDPKANTNEEYLPPVFRKNQSHRRLRGGKDEHGGNICPGSDNAWKIKQSVHLGHDAITDAIEIILQDPFTGNTLHNDVIAYSLAVAIRSSLAHTIGVKEDEFGCAAREQRKDGKIVSVIQIFDAKSGGYCSQANELLLQREFWKTVREELTCKEDCAAACQHCLLSYDTRFSFERLNRHEALGFLTEEWINSYRLAENLRVFGEQTSYEVLEIADSLNFNVAKPLTNVVRLFLHGDSGAWDFPSSQKLNAIILGCISRKIKVELIGAIGLVSKLPESERFKLASYMAIGVFYGEVNTIQIVPNNFELHLVAQIQINHQWKTWATTNPDFAVPNSFWGNVDGQTIYVKGDTTPVNDINYFKLSDVRPKTGDTEIEITHELDGPAIGFGERFWKKLEEKNQQLAQILSQDKDPITLVEYSDRYLRNPLMIALLIDTVNQLKKYPSGDMASFAVHISTVSSSKLDVRPCKNCWDDWKDSSIRDEIIKCALNYCGLNPRLTVESGGAFSTIMHGRSMTLNFASGSTIKVRLDQGFAYWKIDSKLAGQLSFPFTASINEQVEKIANLPVAVISPSMAATQIFVKSQEKKL